MAWTVFGPLGNPTLPELDVNFNTLLAGGANWLCTISGTNALAFSFTAAMPTSLAALSNGMCFYGIAVANNTTSVTATIAGGLGPLNVYTDSYSGPVLLTGGEIIAGTAIWLTYDSALNTGAGGFHLQTGAAALTGQTVRMDALRVGNAGAVGTLAAILTSLATLTFTVVPANTTQDQNATLSSISQGNLVGVTPFSAPIAGLIYTAFAPALGTVTVRCANVTAASIVPTGSVFRISGLKYV